MKRWIAAAVGAVGVLVFASGGFATQEAAAAATWRLRSAADRIGGVKPEVLGAPHAGTEGMSFNGVGDGLIVATNPLAGWKVWTIEVLLRPDEGGAAEQRFFHAEENGDDPQRVMIETRLNGKGGWWLDTFLRGPSERRTLIDPARVHATGKWHWVALRYDGTRMAHFVEGVKEAEGPVTFGPMGPGQVSLGVRLNRVYWFKGTIREVRWSAEALTEERLQRAK